MTYAVHVNGKEVYHNNVYDSVREEYYWFRDESRVRKTPCHIQLIERNTGRVMMEYHKDEAT